MTRTSHQSAPLHWRVSNWNVEVAAGISLYLSLAYILVVNPAILREAGLAPAAVFFATACASGIATILMGLVARLPYAVAPGLEMNGFFAYVVVGTGVGTGLLAVQDAISAVFWSGVMLLLCSAVPGVLDNVDKAIPNALKANISFSVGVFVFATGLKLAGLVPFIGGKPALGLWNKGLLYTHSAGLLYLGFVLSILFTLPALAGLRKSVLPGGLLIVVLICAVLGRMMGVAVPRLDGSLPEMTSGWALFRWMPHHLSSAFVTVVLILFLINFLGGLGKFHRLTEGIPELRGPEGEPRNVDLASSIDGLGTMLGASLGTSSLITYVESSIGIAFGGRGGLTAITCGMLMLVSIFFAPRIGLIPPEATSGLLVYVGCSLFPMKSLRNPNAGLRWFDLFAALIMGVVSFVFFRLDWALLAGFSLYSLLYIVKPGWSARNWMLIGITALLVAAAVLSAVQCRVPHP